MTQPVSVAVVGAGYWGINHVRTFAKLADAELRFVCDTKPSALARAQGLCPSVTTTDSLDEVLASDIDAVVIATLAPTHASLAQLALAAGKDVLVEKPIALNQADAQAVVDCAAQHDRVLMVGHLMLYHPALLRLKRLVDSGELGDLLYCYSARVNLGRLRSDENALWSFAPHDISMVDYLLGRQPTSVAARGQSYLQPGIEDVVFVNLKYPDGQMAQVHLSWLDPRKERRLTVVGSKKMVIFDDVSTHKLTVYDKGYERPPEFTQFQEYLTIRQGDIHIPHLDMTEPLASECQHFLDCVRDRTIPRSDAASALRVVSVLEAAQRSLENDGQPIRIAE